MRIGLTAVILNDQAAFLSRWAEYLSKRTGTPISFVSRDTYQTIVDQLLAAQLDAAWLCGYPYVLHQSRMQLIAVPLYQGKPLYQAYLIRPLQGESDINSWADVKGKVVAFSDPLSNSGWLVAQAQMRAAGVDPRSLKKSFFAYGHRHVAEAVASRLAQAGSIDGYVWETMRQRRMPAVEQTEVAWKSEFFGFPPLVTTHSDNDERVQKLKTVLLDMRNEAEGRDILQALNLTAFEAGSPSLFDSISRSAAAIQPRKT
ncbi:PhnD/SsuA/transferrin family substrate-binding protein [Ramlibacter sp. WS9]|uniref:PhnD/SsuA/transferrin family substrate-binding protein n=1 Tax=Ramlibacter sp. WS9 TaxID=1882741 RepID=UPI0011688A0C|nr:PhnD/SsuA/transferrin family substrate-binding protein [Ramlibacter sp. WS9]ROZ66230.1 phosphonate ABC transporter substrate-binding protein [Ramlibacter sp. WS9]